MGNHALLVSDKGIQAAGHVEKVQRIIEDSGTKVTVFVESIENPTESSVAKCVAVAKKSKIDLIIGLGGGVRWTRLKAVISCSLMEEKWKTFGG